MTVQSDMALLAAGSYWDIRQGEFNTDTRKDTDNRAPLPAGWTLLPQYDISRSGLDSTLLGDGFSARVYQGPGGHIVISLAGTEFGASTSGFIADFISGNIPLAVGRYAEQAYQAADLYQRVKTDPTLSDNISFTGHSLGGGLAAVMSVWFNRPAFVFAAAPFQLSADSWQSTVIPDAISALVLPKVRFKLRASIDPMLAAYDPSLHFAAREANVQAWAVKGELLEARLGAFNWIEAGTTALYNNPANSLGESDKHSIDLHAAALITPNFETQANKVPTALERLFDRALYGYAVTGNQQNILVKLIRNEVGVSNGGMVLLAPNAMLTHFAADLQKLGTNIAGLNRAAQNALIAQGIEWYYWQGTNYAGQEFFIRVEGLLQYTSAQGAVLAGAMNKASVYARTWLNAAYTASTGDTRFAPMGTAFDQWSVATSTDTGAAATAKDASKSQIFIGNGGADSFTGGNKSDVLLADAGNDSMDGGANDDALYGGAGTDTYKFSGAFGNDSLTDSDGNGTIVVDALTLTGGKKFADNLWRSDDKRTVYTAIGGNLVIQQYTVADGNTVSGTMTINGWDQMQGNRLGITLENAVAAAPAVPPSFLIDGTADNDTLTGTAADNLMRGFDGDDSIDASAGGNNWLDGGAGRDVLLGGPGNETMEGGTGRDVMLGQEGADEVWGAARSTFASVDDATVAGLDIEADLMLGGGGADSIYGGASNDALLGGSGNDLMAGGAGDDNLLGDHTAANIDVANWQATRQVTTDAQGNVTSASLQFQGMTLAAALTAGADQVYAGAGDDWVAAGAGADYIDGGIGSDRLWGGGDGDIVDAGAGDDELYGDGTYSSANSLDYTPLAEHGGDIFTDDKFDELILNQDNGAPLFSASDGHSQFIVSNGSASNGEVFACVA